MLIPALALVRDIAEATEVVAGDPQARGVVRVQSLSDLAKVSTKLRFGSIPGFDTRADELPSKGAL